jgi:hypothetical protein
MSAKSIHESLYVSGRSGLVTNCSQSLISASVVDTRILRIGSQRPPGSLRSEPSMCQTARRKGRAAWSQFMGGSLPQPGRGCNLRDEGRSWLFTEQETLSYSC